MADTEIDRLLVRITADATLLKQEFDSARQKVRESSEGMGSDLKEFTDKTRDAGEEVVKLKEQLLALAGAAEFKDLIEGAFEYADGLKKLEQQTGLTTNMLQTLHAAGLQNGIQTDAMDASLKAFTERLGVFATTGAGLAAKAFQTLGVATSNPIAAFDKTITALAKIPDTAERAGLAGQVFGREFGPAMAQMAQMGIDGLAELQRHLEATGALLSGDMIEKAAETKDKFEELEFVFKQAFTEGVIDGFVSQFGNFSDILTSQQFQTAIKNFGEIMGQLAGQVAKIAPYLPNIAGAWAGMKVGAKVGALVPGAGETGGSETIGALAGGTLGAFAPEMFKDDKSVKGQLEAAQRDLDGLAAQKASKKTSWWMYLFGPSDEEFDTFMQSDKDKIAKLQKELDAMPKPKTTTPAFGTVTGKVKPITPKGDDKDIDTIPEDPDAKVIQSLTQKVQLQGLINDGKAREAAIQQALNQLSDKANDGQKLLVSSLAGQLFDEAQAARQKKAIDDVNKSVDEQVNRLNTQTDALKQTDEERFVNQQLLQTENELLQKGVTDLDAKTDALKRVREAATEAYEAQDQQNRVNEVTNMERQAYESLGSSIAQMAATGQVSFKSLLNIGLDVAQQLEEAFLKLALINPIENSLFGGSPGYSNLPTLGDFGSSVFGKIFGGGGTTPPIVSDGPGAGGIFGDMQWLASGGPADPSQAYVVGERGPELFVPNVSGRVVPNSVFQGGGSGGGSRPSVTVNISTPDAGSFLKSQGQVAAALARAVAQGQRNL